MDIREQISHLIGQRNLKCSNCPANSVYECITCDDDLADQILDLFNQWLEEQGINDLAILAQKRYRDGLQEGRKEVVEKIRTDHFLIKPGENSLTQFEPFYQVHESYLKQMEG